MSEYKTNNMLIERFTEPSWLSIGVKFVKPWVLWIVFASLLVNYAFDWGLSTERAVQCLINGNLPEGRLIDQIAGQWYIPALTCIASLTALVLMLGRNALRFPNSRTDWLEVASMAMLWSGTLLIARIIGSFLPDSPCSAAGAGPAPFWSFGHISGASEEIWFVAAVAAWMKVSENRLWTKLGGIIIGGALLRGIFHVYQGWGSAGLFVWGGLVAFGIALTGRWFILFILHYLNNALIGYSVAKEIPWLDNITIPFAMFLISYILCVLLLSDKQSKKRMSTEKDS